MKQLLFLTFLITGFFSFSQNTETGKAIIIHPAVGKVVDNSEKKTFQLFTDYKDSTFNNAIILKYNDSTFTVVVTNIRNQAIEKSISKEELDNMYYKIDEISKTQKILYNEENNNKKKRKQSGPNQAANTYFLAETLVQLTIITLDILFALAN